MLESTIPTYRSIHRIIINIIFISSSSSSVRPVSGLPGRRALRSYATGASFLCYWCLVLKLQLGSVAHSPLLAPPPGMDSPWKSVVVVVGVVIIIIIIIIIIIVVVVVVVVVVVIVIVVVVVVIAIVIVIITI